MLHFIRGDRIFLVVTAALFALMFLGIGSFWLDKTDRLAISAENKTSNCREWNLAPDIRTVPNQENPNRDHCGNLNVWYFMRSSGLNRDPQTYSLLPNFVPDQYGISGLQSWQGLHQSPYWRNTSYPYISMNTTGATQYIGDPPGIETWQPQTVHTHPDQTELMVIGWRSPIDGNIAIAGSVSDAGNV